MTEPEDIVEALGIDRFLVLRILGVLSRFEYSLKRSGLVKDTIRWNRIGISTQLASVASSSLWMILGLVTRFKS